MSGVIVVMAGTAAPASTAAGAALCGAHATPEETESTCDAMRVENVGTAGLARGQHACPRSTYLPG